MQSRILIAIFCGLFLTGSAIVAGKKPEKPGTLPKVSKIKSTPEFLKMPAGPIPKTQVFHNDNCKKNNTCDLKRFSVMMALSRLALA